MRENWSLKVSSIFSIKVLFFHGKEKEKKKKKAFIIKNAVCIKNFHA